MKKEFESLNFELAMEKLEEIVEKLEEGDVLLEEAIQIFEDGMHLSKLCHEKLKKVEMQMDQILQENGEMKPFIPKEDE